MVTVSPAGLKANDGKITFKIAHAPVPPAPPPAAAEAPWRPDPPPHPPPDPNIAID
jgi:hypothetical protein